MKRSQKIIWGLFVVLIVFQFLQPARNESNVSLPTELTKITRVPENVQIILKTACYDCHSNNTVYPWYSSIQPIGWLLSWHIKNGKDELNFSEFGTYPLRRQISKMNEIANSIKDGTMPLSSYTWLHKNARLSKEDKALLIGWALGIKDSLRLMKK